MKQWFRVLPLLLCLALLAGCTLEMEPPESPPAVLTPSPAAACTVEMLDVGQGLSVLIQMDGEYLLYDGGGRERSAYVVSHLRELGVTRLTYMAASHYDEDHISGLVGVLHTAAVEQVLVPDYTAETKIFASFQSALSESGAAVVYPRPGDVFPLGSGQIQVLGPKTWDYPSENDRSIVLRATYGEVSFLLTGDAEQTAEADMAGSELPLNADLYVAGHHGSASSSSPGFVRLVSPSYVFLSCGADNPYGHPAQRTLDTFRACGAEIFRTDRQGAVTACTDGSALWFNTEPCSDWSPGGAAETETELGEGYVLNRSSGKFHRPECDSVSQMKEANRVYTSEPRERLIEQGYSPCGSCKP